MKIPRESNGPVPIGAVPEASPSREPLVRLATLGARDRVGAIVATNEERTAALINRTLPPEGLGPDALQRVWRRFESDRNFRRPSPLRSPVRWGFAAALLLVSGGVVGAEAGVWKWPRALVRKLTGPLPASPGLSPLPPVAAARVPARKIAVNRPDVPLPPMDVSEASPPPTVEPVISPREMRARPRVQLPPAPSENPVVVAPQSALSEESLVVGRALTRLRQARDPDGALLELDQYASRFPSGMLVHEAQNARIDALLMSGRLAEARNALSKLTLGTGGRDRELRLIRAELAAEGGCAAALKDYDVVWAQGESGPLAARALWGRAVCRARLGDEAGARSDLVGYLARFPDGPQAAAVRARLKN